MSCSRALCLCALVWVIAARTGAADEPARAQAPRVAALLGSDSELPPAVPCASMRTGATLRDAGCSR